MGQGLCCNLNIKFPKLCCSQYLPCCAKSRPWDPDNPVGGDARQKTLQGAYDAALTARDYRAAERYKHQLWLTIEQGEPPDVLLVSALLRSHLHVCDSSLLLSASVSVTRFTGFIFLLVPATHSLS